VHVAYQVVGDGPVDLVIVMGSALKQHGVRTAVMSTRARRSAVTIHQKTDPTNDEYAAFRRVHVGARMAG
jgi:hypothetical protein